MITLEDHNKQNILLAKSLVLKISDAALAINKDVLAKGHKVTENMKTWKYYLNLAGEKHPTNKDVNITVLENASIQPLTKELLEKYPYTKAELLKNDLFYQELINKNPEEYNFIHGCMYPVDINKAIIAKEGSVLAYNHTLVEPNEYNLIKEINSYTTGFVSRWHNREYTIIEELYLPAMLAILYSTLPAKILNLRMEKMLTSEVHTFHVEHMLRSNLDIYDAVSFLPKETVIWLYKNIEGIKKNIGKESNFNLIVNKLLTPSNIGVGKYNLYKNNPKLVEDRLPTASSKFEYNDTKVLIEHLNEYLTSKGLEKDTHTVVVDEMKDFMTADLTELEKTSMSNMSTLINSNLTEEIKNTKEFGTKVVEIETYKYFKRHGQDLFKTVLDHIIYGVQTNIFRFNITYIEPNTGIQYKVTPRGALLMLIKCLMWITGNKDLKLTSIYYDLVLEPDATCFRETYKILLQDNYVNKIIPALEQAWPPLGKICSSNLDVGTLMNAVINFFVTTWTFDVNSENSMVSCQVKYLLNACMQNGKYVLSTEEEGIDIDTLLKEEDITYQLQDSYNLYGSISSLVMAIANIDLDELVTIRDINTAFKTLVTKLVAYTTQILTTDIGENSIYVFYNNTNICRTEQGAARIDKADIKALEEDYIKVDPYANNFMAEGFNNTIPNAEIRTYEKIDPWNIKGYARFINRTGYDVTYPITHVQVIDPNIPGDNNFPWEEPQLIFDLKGSITALEEDYVKAEISSTTIDLTPRVYSMVASVDVQTVIQNSTLPINGFFYNQTDYKVGIIRPTVMAHVIDTFSIGMDPKNWKGPEITIDPVVSVEPLEQPYVKVANRSNVIKSNMVALNKFGTNTYSTTDTLVEELPPPTQLKKITSGIMIQPALAVEITE